MVRIILALIFLFAPSQIWAFGVQQGISGAVAGGGGSCDTVVWSNTTAGTSDFDINDNEFYYIVGNRVTPASETTVCKVDFYISYKAGDISGKTFRAFIYTTSVDALNSGTEADSTVSGNNSWSDSSNSTGTVVSFEWSGGYTMSGSTEYAIVVRMDGAADTSNYAELEYSTSTAFPGGETIGRGS